MAECLQTFSSPSHKGLLRNSPDHLKLQALQIYELYKKKGYCPDSQWEKMVLMAEILSEICILFKKYV